VFGSPVTTKRSVRDGVESQTQTTPTLEEAIKEAKYVARENVAHGGTTPHWGAVLGVVPLRS
jgi:hypothetical protein